MKDKLIIDVDGTLIIYYDGVFKTDPDILNLIKQNAFMGKTVNLFPNMEPVKSSLEEKLENIAAAIISIYPERARIIDAPEHVVNKFVPQ